MRGLILALILILPGCSTIQKSSDYAESLYEVARVAGEQAVTLGKLSPEKFEDLDRRAQLALLAFRTGAAGIEQLVEIVKELKKAKSENTGKNENETPGI